MIDEEARAAQQRQEDAHKKREKIVRVVEMNQLIRIKEQELESTQLVSNIVRQNVSEDDHPAGASALTPSSLQEYVATASFYGLPPSKIYTPAPSNMRYAKSHFDSTPLLSQIGYPSASQTLPVPQPL